MLKYQVSLINYPTQALANPNQESFEILMKNCKAQQVSWPQPFPDQEYTITDASKTLPSQLTVPSYCLVTSYSATYTIGLVPLLAPKAVSLDSSTGTFTFESSELDIVLGLDKIELQVTIEAQLYDSSSQTFKLELKNPCVDHNMMKITIPDTPTYEYMVSTKPATFVLTATPTASLTICGEVSLKPSVVSPNVLSFNEFGELDVGQGFTEDSNGNIIASTANIYTTETQYDFTDCLDYANESSAKFSCFVLADSEIIMNTTQAHLVNYKKAMVFDAYLTDYETMITTFVVVIDFIECIVASDSIILPSYDDIEFDLDTQKDWIKQTFLPFISTDADICGFKWEYTVKPDASFQILPTETEEEYIYFNNVAAPDIPAIQINAPQSAVRQTTVVTITGVLITQSEPITLTTDFVLYYKNEDEAFEGQNNEPHFQEYLQSTYTFDIATISQSVQIVELGTLFDIEGNEFIYYPSQDATAESYLWISTDASGFWSLNFDPSIALVSTAKPKIIIEELIPAKRISKITINVEVINSAEDQELPIDELDLKNDDKDQPKTPAFEMDTSKFAKSPKVSTQTEAVQEEIQNIPKPYITKVTNTGKLQINFSSKRQKENLLDRRRLQEVKEAFKGPPGQSHKADHGVEAKLTDANDEEQDYVQGTIAEGSLDVSGIIAYIRPGDMSTESSVKFSYKIEGFSNTKMEVSLSFETPTEVSSSVSKDTLVIKLRDFRDLEGNLIVDEQEINVDVPNQIDEAAGLVAAVAGEACASSVGASVTINIILNFIMSGSMNQMLSSIKNLQVIVHLVLMAIIVPAVANIFLAELFKMIAFDPVDVSDQINQYFSLQQLNKELDEVFVNLGYESAHFLTNLGSLLVIIIVQIIIQPILWVVKMNPLCFKRVRKYAGKQLDSCFCNGILTVIDGTFLLLVLASMINLQKEYQGEVSKDSSYYFSIIALIICAIELIAVPIFFVRRGRKGLMKEKSKKRCDYIYGDLNFRIRGGWALAYPILYQLRFCWLVFLILFLGDYLVLQVLLIELSTIYLMATLGSAHPYADIKRNYISILNEFVIVVIADLLLFSSDPALDGFTRLYLGWAIVGVLGLSILYSQGSLFYNAIKNLCKQIRNYYTRRLNRKQQRSLMASIKQKNKSLKSQKNQGLSQIGDQQVNQQTFGAEDEACSNPSSSYKDSLKKRFTVNTMDHRTGNQLLDQRGSTSKGKIAYQEQATINLNDIQPREEEANVNCIGCLEKGEQCFVCQYEEENKKSVRQEKPQAKSEAKLEISADEESDIQDVELGQAIDNL